jgi:hypothetical protein
VGQHRADGFTTGPGDRFLQTIVYCNVWELSWCLFLVCSRVFVFCINDKFIKKYEYCVSRCLFNKTKEAPLQLLHEANISGSPDLYLLNRAKELVRRGVVSRRNAAVGGQRSRRQQRAAVDKLVGVERYSAAMAAVDRIALESEYGRSVEQAWRSCTRKGPHSMTWMRSTLSAQG